jgi:hypothetical protein
LYLVFAGSISLVYIRVDSNLQTKGTRRKVELIFVLLKVCLCVCRFMVCVRKFVVMISYEQRKKRKTEMAEK